MEKMEFQRLIKYARAEDLRERAEKALLEDKGSHVFVRGLIEFSNICHRNCLYCGLRAQNLTVRRYCLQQDEIMAAAARAVDCGADSIVLQSGEGAAQPEWVAEVVSEIVATLGVPVTLSLGEQPFHIYEMWRRAGAARYLLKHETADPKLYARLHPGYSLAERVACLRTLGELGYEVGSGFMVGLPGQTVESLADDIMLCVNLNVAMAGIGPFIPQGDTPLARCEAGETDLVLRLISILRIALPHANLPATTALASLDKAKGQENGLRAGANVLMPSFTPRGEAASYSIYDHKNRVSIADAIKAIEASGRSHNLIDV